MELKTTFAHYYPEGSVGGQCAAFAEQLSAFGPVGNLYADKLAYFKAHGSTNLSDIQVGDVLLLNVGVNGHVCIVNDVVGNAWQVTESNWNLDERIHHTRLLAKTSPLITAHLRAPLKVALINPPSTMIQKKILVLLSNIPAENLAYFQRGVQAYCDKVQARTNGQFRLQVDYAPTNQVIHTLAGTNADNQPVVFPDPNDIKAAGEAISSNYQAYCLFYNDTTVVGPHPTNPGENLSLFDNHSILSIPMNWIATVPPTFPDHPIDGSAFSAEFFFGHENSHSDFTLVNAHGLGLRDQTHDQNPYGNQRDIDNPNVADFYVDLLIQLTPYWHYLGIATQAESSTMNLINDNGTFFLVGIVGGVKKKIGISNFDFLQALRTITDQETTGSTAGIPQVKVIKDLPNSPSSFQISDN